MRYLMKFNENNIEKSRFTQEEVDDIQDMFLDIVDEFSLTKSNVDYLIVGEYTFSKLKKSDIIGAIMDDYELVRVIVCYETMEPIKSFNELRDRLKSIGYSVNFNTWKMADKKIQFSFLIRKNLNKKFESIDSAISKPIDMSIIKDVFNDLVDEFDDIDIDYNRQTSLGVKLIQISVSKDFDNKILQSKIDALIYKSINYYYQETDNEITAYITKPNYKYFFSNNNINFYIYFVNKVTSSNIQHSKHFLPSGETWESFTYANYIYQGSIK